MGAAVVVAHQGAIELQRVWLGWREHIAVRDASGVFAPGSLTAIVGPNGAGKSTLIKGMMGRMSPLKGNILLGRGVAREMVCLPQEIGRTSCRERVCPYV